MSMINGQNHVSLSELDSALAFSGNLLRIFELAKDVSSLQTVADSARADLKASEDKAAEVADAVSALNDLQLKVDADRSKVDSDRAQANLEISRVAAGFADLDKEREARQSERTAHDIWAAGVRETMAAERAKIDSDADQLRRRTEALVEREALVEASLEAAKAQRDAADVLKTSYEHKLEQLRAMAG